MITDKFGQQIYNENELCDLFLSNTNVSLRNVLTDKKIEFSTDLELTNILNFTEYKVNDISISDFDKQCQNNYYIPQDYIDLDIAQYVLSRCKTDAELQRAGQELLLFQERNMFMLLKYLKYFVDTLKQNNIIWGVGRGSSVASFVLYLLGVHKINSLYYDLPIEEFLK